MFFVLSKLFWLVAAPGHLISLLALIGFACLLVRLHRTGRTLIGTAALLLVVLGIFPIWAPMIRGLEERYPRPPLPTHVDGVLILGSGFNTAVLKARGVPHPNEGSYRVLEAFAVARRHPEARIVYSGGSGALGGAPYSEGETARYMFNELGLDPSRLLLEQHSRNTYENILFSKALVKNQPGEVWLLATSAYHMPRAMAVAKELNWQMLPWPTDYLTTPDGGGELFDITGNLERVDYALHEWIGILIYQLNGNAR